MKEEKITSYERDNIFFKSLEIVLDEYFPKVEEEGEEKRLMKRGQALQLFTEANLIHSRRMAEKIKEAEERGHEIGNQLPMAEEVVKKEVETEFKLLFKNGALDNLKRLSKRFNVPEEDLDKVVEKAVKLLTYVKDSKDGKITFEETNGERYFVNINEL